MSMEPPRDKEIAFKKKVAEMGLRVTYKESSRQCPRQQVMQYRLELTFFNKGNKQIEFTTGGFWGKNAYRESAFEQGLRRLHKLQASGYGVY